MQTSIVIMDHSSTSIVINELKKKDKIYIVVYKYENEKSITLFKEKKDKWRFVFLKNIHSSQIFVKCKLLKIMFENCEHCNIFLRQPIIGSCEFLRCKNIVCNIKINFIIDNIPIPYIRIELCDSFEFIQSVGMLVYIINSSYGITGTLIDNSKFHNQELGGKLFWNEQEQSIVSFSIEGVVSISQQYILNDISNHLIIKSLEPLSDCIENIGITPPFE